MNNLENREILSEIHSTYKALKSTMPNKIIDLSIVRKEHARAQKELEEKAIKGKRFSSRHAAFKSARASFFASNVAQC